MSRLLPKRLLALLGLYGAAFVATAALGGMAYFHYGDPGDTCASCHEMSGVYSNWLASSHHSVSCRECHGGSLTLDIHAMKSHVDRIVRHFTGDPSRPVRIQERHVLALHDSCRRCHPRAWADWQASRHSTTYARILLDPDHNRTAPPSNDCLRCHGMFFQGDIKELVAAPASSGAWSLRDTARATQPAIPCLACHQVHAPADATRDSAFYDHRERTHVPAGLLPVGRILQGERAVKVSLDPRARVCVECHAPSSTRQLGSSDDRTPAGVHEGLSCADCHAPHGPASAATCRACHPSQSHCGIPVERMDTSFLSKSSAHNVHTVACADCHPAGVPGRTAAAAPPAQPR